MNINELPYLLRANTPIIALECPSVERDLALESIYKLSYKLNYKVFFWTFGLPKVQELIEVNGVVSNKEGEFRPTGWGAEQLNNLLDHVCRYDEDKAIFIILGAQSFLQGSDLNIPTLCRIQTLYSDIKGSKPKRHIIFVGDGFNIANVLSGIVCNLEIPLPTISEIASHLTQITNTITQVSSVKYELTLAEEEVFTRSVLGLTLEEISNICEYLAVRNQVIDARAIQGAIAYKQEKLKRYGCDFCAEPDVNQIGGQEYLASWLSEVKILFSQEARKHGLPYPKGCVLLGLPGSGKSLAAKIAARDWNMPAVRLNISSLQGSLVGQSEANLRSALKIATAMSPCILVVEELDKDLAGVNSTHNDGGVLRRMLGILLSWLQDRVEPVFVIATANNLKGIPSELLREGRFDQIFFCDLPNYEGRLEILKIQSQHWKLDIPEEHLEAIADTTSGFSGSDLAALIYKSYQRAFIYHRPGKPTIDDIHIIKIGIVPVGEREKDNIEELRRQGALIARPAGKVEF